MPRVENVLARHIHRAVGTELGGRREAWRLAKAIGAGQVDPLEVASALEGRPMLDPRDEGWGGLLLTYFMRMDAPLANRPIKIGCSASPVGRRMTILTGSPWEITVLGTFPHRLLPEITLHNYFGWRRLRGEWFRNGGELKQLAAAVARIEKVWCGSPNRSRACLPQVSATAKTQKGPVETEPVTHSASVTYA